MHKEKQENVSFRFVLKICNFATSIFSHLRIESSGQSYKHFTLVNYDSRVVPDWKIPHITTLES